MKIGCYSSQFSGHHHIDGHEHHKRIFRHARFYRLYALKMGQVPNSLERGIHMA
jgi:hypothetical protein